MFFWSLSLKIWFGFVTLIEDGDNLKPVEENTWHENDGKKYEVKVARSREENVGPQAGVDAVVEATMSDMEVPIISF